MNFTEEEKKVFFPRMMLNEIDPDLIEEITLLDADDIKDIPQKVLAMNDYWWLKPRKQHMSKPLGHWGSTIAPNGKQTDCSTLINDPYVKVKPVAILKDNAKLKNYSTFYLGKERFTVIPVNGKKYGICNGDIGSYAMNPEKDPNMTYKTSPIRNILKDWSEQAIEINNDRYMTADKICAKYYSSKTYAGLKLYCSDTALRAAASIAKDYEKTQKHQIYKHAIETIEETITNAFKSDQRDEPRTWDEIDDMIINEMVASDKIFARQKNLPKKSREQINETDNHITYANYNDQLANAIMDSPEI